MSAWTQTLALRHRSTMVAGLGVAGTTGYAVLVVWAAQRLPYDLWGALLVTPALLALSVPMLRAAARVEDDPVIVRLLVVALVLKLAGALARYFISWQFYGGLFDAALYDTSGRAIAEQLSQGSLAVSTARGVPGTGGLEWVTGVVYTLTGPTALGGFLAFSWLAFWGLVLFYRAFRVAVPGGDHRRYALLVFFLPSLVFWPSSIGKEAWMVLVLGISAYGAARILVGLRGGYPLLLIGMAGTLLVRPHMALLVGLALVPAILIRGRHAYGRRRGVVGQVVTLLVVVAVAWGALQQTQEFFDIESLTGAEDVFATTELRTSQGGSEFDPPAVTSPLDLPAAIPTVLFRPWPQEAHNLQARIASLEGLVLLALLAVSARRLARVPRALRRWPYLVFVVVYVLVFVVAFSHIANFGILTRQRVQLLPFLLALLALPPHPHREDVDGSVRP